MTPELHAARQQLLELLRRHRDQGERECEELVAALNQQSLLFLPYLLSFVGAELQLSPVLRLP